SRSGSGHDPSARRPRPRPRARAHEARAAPCGAAGRRKWGPRAGTRRGWSERPCSAYATAEQKRPAVSLRLVADAPVALVDHARAERPGLDEVQRDVVGDGWQERRAATDDDRVAEHAQLVDEAELDRRRGRTGAADRDILVGRVERRGDLLGQ